MHAVAARSNFGRCSLQDLGHCSHPRPVSKPVSTQLETTVLVFDITPISSAERAPYLPLTSSFLIKYEKPSHSTLRQSLALPVRHPTTTSNRSLSPRSLEATLREGCGEHKNLRVSGGRYYQSTLSNACPEEDAPEGLDSCRSRDGVARFQSPIPCTDGHGIGSSIDFRAVLGWSFESSDACYGGYTQRHFCKPYGVRILRGIRWTRLC